MRFHNALRELSGREGIRDDVSRYEAAALMLVDPAAQVPGEVLPSYPKPDSVLRIERFFETLYLKYDERYVYSAPDLKSVTRRKEWSEASGIFAETLLQQPGALGYEPRTNAGTPEQDPADTPGL